MFTCNYLIVTVKLFSGQLCYFSLLSLFLFFYTVACFCRSQWLPFRQQESTDSIWRLRYFPRLPASSTLPRYALHSWPTLLPENITDNLQLKVNIGSYIRMLREWASFLLSSSVLPLVHQRVSQLLEERQRPLVCVAGDRKFVCGQSWAEWHRKLLLLHHNQHGHQQQEHLQSVQSADCAAWW